MLERNLQNDKQGEEVLTYFWVCAAHPSLWVSSHGLRRFMKSMASKGMVRVSLGLALEKTHRMQACFRMAVYSDKIADSHAIPPMSH